MSFLGSVRGFSRPLSVFAGNDSAASLILKELDCLRLSELGLAEFGRILIRFPYSSNYALVSDVDLNCFGVRAYSLVVSLILLTSVSRVAGVLNDRLPDWPSSGFSSIAAKVFDGLSLAS